LKIAVTKWNGRIAPVFDVAEHATILETNAGSIIGEDEVILPVGCPRDKIMFLRGLDVRQLICGALSCHARAEAEAAGIKLYGFIAGDYHDILEAWRNGLLFMAEYAMPGCGQQNRCCRRRRKHNNPPDGIE